MKKAIISIFTGLSLAITACGNGGGTHQSSSEANTHKIEVGGSCGMCESRIEEAAKTVSGVTSADYNLETKILEVSFAKEASMEKIEAAVASAGHDTPNHKADDAVYNALPGCCKYRQ